MCQLGFETTKSIPSGDEIRILLTIYPYSSKYCYMKTTIDIPDALLQRAKVEAARRKSTLKVLVQNGLELALREEAPADDEALMRLRQGFHLGGSALSREEVYERRPLS